MPCVQFGLPCTLHAPPPPPTPSHLSPRVSPSVSPVVTRQLATAFNQPLSLDTSSATTMRGMFRVRPRRMQLPRCRPGLPCTLRAPPPPPPRPRASRPACHPSVRLVTRQETTVFNQPLSFDMSSVTDMSQMFDVRLYRAQRPAGSSVHAACTATAPTPSRLPPRVSPSMCLGCDSAARVGVQPAAEPRHVQRHDHAGHV